MTGTSHQTRGDGWDGVLDPGEAILWQGRPDGRVKLRGRTLVPVLFGLFFAGFALVWMILASLGGGFFWMFGLLHFSVGVGIVASGIAGEAWRLRHTWYTLTDRRAFVATALPFSQRRLKSYTIHPDTVLTLEEDGALASLYFAEEHWRNRNRNGTRRIGFERIADAPAVYAMMRRLQTGTARGTIAAQGTTPEGQEVS